jgi:hypothetical protein
MRNLLVGLLTVALLTAGLAGCSQESKEVGSNLKIQDGTKLPPKEDPPPPKTDKKGKVVSSQ